MHMRGQVSIVNLIGLLVVLFLLFAFLPMITSLSDSTVAILQSSPNDYTSYYVSAIRLIPFVMIVAVILTAINYAVPRREGVLR